MTGHLVGRRKHLVLVGLPGSGKSTVGSLVAESLSVPFFDVDKEVERATGRQVADIFREQGEEHFRRLETQSMLDLVKRSNPAVLAPGGGWVAQPGNLQMVESRVVCAYLETSPEIAVARASQAGGRPLLPEGLELSAMQELLRNRERFYAAAELRVRTDEKAPVEIARQVAELARMRGAL